MPSIPWDPVEGARECRRSLGTAGTLGGRGGTPSSPYPAPPPPPGSLEGQPADEEGGGLQPEEEPQMDPVLTAAPHLLGRPRSQ